MTHDEVSPSFMDPQELLYIWDPLHAASCPSSDLWKLQEQLLIIFAPYGLSSSCPSSFLNGGADTKDVSFLSLAVWLWFWMHFVLQTSRGSGQQPVGVGVRN